MYSTTQWVWFESLKMPEYLPDKPAKSDKCWLCGGETNNNGWRVKDVISSAFTDFNAAKEPASDAICGACAGLMKKDTWELACEKHGHSPYFPIAEGSTKKPFMSSWMFSSHIFTKDKWLRPDRTQARDFLLSDPDYEYVMTLADVGKKHVIFKSEVKRGGKHVVNIDEKTHIFIHDEFLTSLNDIETLYNAGFSKASIASGDYSQKNIIDYGLVKTREMEKIINKQRCTDAFAVSLFLAKKN